MMLSFSAIATGDIQLTQTPEGTLTLRSPAGAIGGGVVLNLEGESRDWSAAKCLAFTLRANGAHRLRVQIEHARGHWTFYLVPRPGLTSRVALRVEDLKERPPNTSYPGYSTFGGGPEPVELAHIHALTITFNQVSPEDKALALGEFTLHDRPLEPSLLDPRRVVDEWGQWTGERGAPRREAEIRAAWDVEEEAVFDGFTGQTDRTGADWAGSRGEGTGFFRVARSERRWWLVDPDGHPFFSLGCDCVRPGAEGPVGGREALFADLTGAAWQGTGTTTGRRWKNPLWADFYQRNLRRRYGEDDGNDRWAEQTVTRLRRWGFNTIANWSDPALTRRGRMPYTTNIGALAPLCARLPDVYAPHFAQQVGALVEPEVAPCIGDPLLIGYFVGNEPTWTFGGHRHPFNDLFVSDEYAHTRVRARDWVRQAYGDDLGAVNAAWDARLSTWDDLMREGAVPDVRLGSEALRRDADGLLGDLLAMFYDTCCAAIRTLDPDHLLLGGRFYTANMAEPYVRACRAFDVYSFNCYGWSPPADAIARITALSGLPVLIGEFHYGVEGRGLNGSLIATASQDERGLAYRHFVENAAALPSVVGAHWFQWVDQPVTGRFDGEFYNIGLVDVTDLPYDAFLEQVRETHARLYTVCRGEEPPYVYPGERPAAW